MGACVGAVHRHLGHRQHREAQEWHSGHSGHSEDEHHDEHSVWSDEDCTTEELKHRILEELHGPECEPLFGVVFVLLACVAVYFGESAMHVVLFERYFAIMNAAFLVTQIFNIVKMARDHALAELRDHEGLPIAGAAHLEKDPAWLLIMVLTTVSGVGAIIFGMFHEVDDDKLDSLQRKAFLVVSYCFLVSSTFHLAMLMRDRFEAEVFSDEVEGGAWAAAYSLEREMMYHQHLQTPGTVGHENLVGQAKRLPHKEHFEVPAVFTKACLGNVLTAMHEPLTYEWPIDFFALIVPLFVQIYYTFKEVSMLSMMLNMFGSVMIWMSLSPNLLRPAFHAFYKLACWVLALIFTIGLALVVTAFYLAFKDGMALFYGMTLILCKLNVLSSLFGLDRLARRSHRVNSMSYVHREHFARVQHRKKHTGDGDDEKGTAFMTSRYHMSNLPQWFHAAT